MRQWKYQIHSKKVCVGWFFCSATTILFCCLKHGSRFVICIWRNKRTCKKWSVSYFIPYNTLFCKFRKNVSKKTISITIKIAPFQSTLHCSLCSKLFMLHKRVLSIFKFAECSRIALFFICKELLTVTFHNLKKTIQSKVKKFNL